jgi:hypothetical protein
LEAAPYTYLRQDSYGNSGYTTAALVVYWYTADTRESMSTHMAEFHRLLQESLDFMGDLHGKK